MQHLIDLLKANYQWLFSGAGVTTVLILGSWAIRRARRRRRAPEEPIDGLNVHIQPSSISAHNDHENYDTALGIYISNASGFDVPIVRASFSPSLKRLGVPRRTKLPIYPFAFRDRLTGSYELKFGDQWREFGVLVPRGKRVFTYLPLSRPVTAEELEAQKNGTIILEYDTRYGRRLHVVRV